MAIEQIVDAYVRLKNGSALMELRAHRQRLIVTLNKLRSNYDVSLALGKMTEDLAIIDAGIEQLEAQGDIDSIVRALPASPWS